MPWEPVGMHNGYTIPSIAFGTAAMVESDCVHSVEQALSLGFKHLDCAQLYENEAEVGIAIRQSGLARSDVFITSKFTASHGLDIKSSIAKSLKDLGVDYLDLYLVHSPSDLHAIPDVWRQFEELVDSGLTKSIGVSNFSLSQLKSVLDTARIKPVVNQISFHPYLSGLKAPLLAFAAEHGIVIAAYGALSSITRFSGGPVDDEVHAIAQKLAATTDQVLLAWLKAKAVIVVATSLKRARLEGYLAAGDLVLTAKDVAGIDNTGTSAVIC